MGAPGVPPDPSMPLTSPPPPPARRILNGLGGAHEAEREVALRPAATNGWVGAARRRLPPPPAGRPGVRGASLNPLLPPPPPAPRPAPLPAGGRARAVTREGAGAADLEETGRAGPPAPAADIWPLRPALTPEVAPGPRRRRPFVSGAAWRRARRSPHLPLRLPPLAAWRGRQRPRRGGVGVQHLRATPPPPHPAPGSARLGLGRDPSFRLPSIYHPLITGTLDNLRPSGSGGHRGAHGRARLSGRPLQVRLKLGESLVLLLGKKFFF